MDSGGSNYNEPPAQDEIEISVLGPGLGECVIVHVGLGDWIVIDSCKDPQRRKPAAEIYLEDIGVNIATAVKMVVASHWHNDHIQGLPQFLRIAESAEFACAGALNNSLFWEIMDAWDPSEVQQDGSGIDEICSVLQIIRERREVDTCYPTPTLATPNRILWERHGSPCVSVRSLSPSDAASLITLQKLHSIYVSQEGGCPWMPDLSENEISVVMSVDVAGERVLLGADMQVRVSDRGLGWLAIVDDCRSGMSPHSVFKIPHHGSENGDHDEIWQTLMSSDTHAIVTPFMQGRVKLPTLDDCRRLYSRSSRCFLTAPPRARYSHRIRTVEKTLKEVAKDPQKFPGKYGHVRIRKKLGVASSDSWRVELFGDAMPIENYLGDHQ